MEGLFPVIIGLLIVGWLALPAAVVLRLRSGQRMSDLIGAGVLFLLALLLALFMAPAPPVVSTFTGFSHLESAIRIAGLDWGGMFSPDHPLTVPVLTALPVALGVKPLLAVRLISCLLFALGAAGSCLLALRWFQDRWIAGAAGLVAATMPLALVFAGGDSLVIGVYALTPWTLLFALECADGGWTAALGLASSLVLLAQARLEALPLTALVLAAGLVSAEGSWSSRLRRFLPAAGAALLALLPYLAMVAHHIVFSGRLARELRFRLLDQQAVLALLVLAVVAGGWLLYRYAGRRAWLGPLFGLVVCVGLLAWLVLFQHGDLLKPETASHHLHPDIRTWASVFCWPCNPKWMPLGLSLALFAGLGSARSRRELWQVGLLACWFLLVMLLASIKNTGELPLEGARTQLPALAPFALLAGMGVGRLVSAARRPWPGAALALLLILGTSWGPYRNLADFRFNPQAATEVVSGCVGELPEGAVLVLPDEPVPDAGGLTTWQLFRGRSRGAAHGIRTMPVSELLQRGLPDAPVYFLQGLDCQRTGRLDPAPGCMAMNRRFRLTPVCGAEIENRIYAGDFIERLRIERDRIPIRVHRVLPRGR